MPLEFSASEGDALGGLLFYLESEYSFRFEAGSPLTYRTELAMVA